jgi:putative NADPH-quinone reductase
MAKILMLLCHPNLSGDSPVGEYAVSVSTNIILKVVRDLPGLYINDLYEHYPDFNIDVDREQDLLLAHDMVVLQTPLSWFSTPPLFKKWQDDVYTYGFAYGMKTKPLAGKDFLLSMTVGGRHADTEEEAGKIIDTHMLPLRKATEMAGFSWLPPLYSFGLINSPGIDPREDVTERATEHGARLREFLSGYQEGIT